jgi:tryptophan synthase alpha subunit
MSKVYSEQVQKANTLVAGLRKNYDSVKNFGISHEQIDRMEECAKAVASMSAEVDELRATLNAKATAANRKLMEMKDAMRDAKQIVKHNFEQTKWEGFGIPDKR